MTNTTEQERSEFEKAYREVYSYRGDKENDYYLRRNSLHPENYYELCAVNGWKLWQAHAELIRQRDSGQGEAVAYCGQDFMGRLVNFTTEKATNSAWQIPLYAKPQQPTFIEVDFSSDYIKEKQNEVLEKAAKQLEDSSDETEKHSPHSLIIHRLRLEAKAIRALITDTQEKG